MAFVKIRGGQIQDNVIQNIHIASDAAIQESKLSINWASHYQEALETKKVVDFVQVNGISVTGSQFDLTANGTIAATATKTTSDPLDVEGIIVGGEKNYAPVRDAVTGDPLLSASNSEVFGRVDFVAADAAVPGSTDKFVLNLVSKEDDGAGNIVEQPFDAPAGTVVDFQFAQRFNLQTVNEMFAANEKFVEGAADATAHLNLEQLAKDIYGPLFSLDRDGSANLSRNLVDEILIQTRGVVNDGVRANTIIDEVVVARGAFADLNARLVDIEGKVSQEATDRANADQAIRDDLASVEAAKGASLIGIEDAAAKFTATTVEGALTEIDGRLDELKNGGSSTGNEVKAARKSTALTGVEVEHVDLDTRLEAGETQIKANQDEITAARGTEASLDARLDRALNENGTLKAGTQIHTHKKFVYQATGGETAVALPAGQFFQAGDDTLDVYVNGLLQAEGIHYTEVADATDATKGTGVDFNPEILVDGDVIIFKYQTNNAE